jgi:hypothetical protein
VDFISDEFDSSISVVEDAAYLDGVKRSDMERAQDWFAIEYSRTFIDILMSHGYDAVEIYEGASNLFLLDDIQILHFAKTHCNLREKRVKYVATFFWRGKITPCLQVKLCS